MFGSGFTPATNSYRNATDSPQPPVSASAIGKIATLAGPVTILRANMFVAQSVVGDAVYRGDVIETGDDASVTIGLVDGTRFQLYAGTRMVLDEFVGGTDNSSGSALLRIVEGMFAVAAGKLARAGRLIIETPLGQIRSRGPATGIGSVALGVLTFSLIKELQAQGAGPNPPGLPNTPDHVVINDNDLKEGKLDYAQGDPNDLDHGVFVIDTYDGKHYEVSDVTKTLWIHGGSSEFITNNMAALHADYLGAKDVYNDFRNDAFFDQYRHAKADPTSTGNGGSGDPNSILGLNLGGSNNQFQQNGGLIVLANSGGPTEGGNSGGTGLNIIPPPPVVPPAPTIAVPPPQTLGVTHTGAIFGVTQTGAISVSVAETGSTPDEIFTVTLADNNGLLSANTSAPGGGGTITGSGTNTLVIQGTLSQVNINLTTLSDTNNTAGVDNITVHATDSFSNSASPAIIAVTVNGPPVISLPDPVIGVGQTAAISGVSLSETGNTAGETFTVTLTDTNGVLAATGGSFDSATHTLTISGSLSQVNAALATLTDTNNSVGADNITVQVTDSFGNNATAQLPLTVNTGPVISVPGPQTIGVDQSEVVPSVSIAESGNTAGETFTVVLTDNTGFLAANTLAPGGGGTITGSGTNDLVIQGTLSQVNADLATLTDKNGTAGPDNITVQVTDSLGNIGTQTFGVTVATAPVISGPGPQTIGISQTDPITGVSVSETGNATGETFTAVLTDSTGQLSATGATAGNGSHALTIANVSLSQLNADLATLTDNNGTQGPDNITVQVTDSFGNVGTQSFDVTVAAAPVIGLVSAQTIGINQTTLITVGTVTENFVASGETFTAVVTDSTGQLSATGASGDGTNTLTIANVSLSQLNADLATLTDKNGTAGPDNITVQVTDSFGNNAGTQTIAVTVAAQPVTGGPGPQTIGINKTDPITIGTVTENFLASGETFTAVLTDSTGQLSATGATAGNGSHALTIANVSLSQLNADLATLTDNNGTAGPDNISMTVTDSFGNFSTQTFDVTVAAAPVVAAVSAQMIGINHTTLITVGTVTENFAASSETFMAVVIDSTGQLSATGATAGNGSHALTIANVSLSQLNADLATLTDNNGTQGPDNITVQVTDSFGNVGTQSFDVTVAAAPVIGLVSAQTIGINQTTLITVGTVTENFVASGETFTAVVTDSTGQLSATGASGDGTNTLTIANVSLSQLNADLATLTDKNGTAGPDNITVQVTDSFGNNAGTQTIAVTVAAQPVTGGPGPQTIGINKTDPITIGTVTENFLASGETFTAVLTDSTGQLSATGATAGNGTHALTIANVSLSQLNADLATLTDNNGTAGPDNISMTVTDSFGNFSTQSFDVTVAAAPVVAAVSAQMIGINHTTLITVGTVTENFAASSETFMAVVIDSTGQLSATGATAGNGSHALTIANVSLSQLNADLATLTDNNGTQGPDNITVQVTDSFGNVGTQSFDVTVAAAPVIGLVSAQTIGINQTTLITVGTVTENFVASGETFTAVVTDSTGQLSATGASGDGTNTLTIANVSLSQLNADLATLTDKNGTAGPDNITVQVTDSFGNNAGTQTIAVTVAAQPVTGGPGPQTIGINKTDPITIGTVTENFLASGETFTAVLTDSTGQLSATGATAGNGTHALTIANVSLSQLNADLATLTDNNGTAGPDNISMTVTDSFGNFSTQSFDVTVAAAPVVAAVSAQMIGINHTTLITVGTVTENFAASSETFMAVVIDSTGQLSATGATAGNGSHALTIANVSLSQLNADLATLTDNNGTQGPDNITVQVTDSFGNVGTQSFDVTVAAAPVIGLVSAQTIGINQTTLITVGTVTENFVASGETFTAVVTDSTGQLSATGASGDGTNTLTIANVSLSQLNADLATLTDKNGTAGPDNITVQVTDSFGNNAGTQTIAVTVAAQPVTGGPGPQTIGINKTDPITIGTVTENFLASGETFTAVLTDSTGQLSATGATAGNGSHALTIANVSLSQLNADLATLTDNNGTAGPDNISMTVTDSFGNFSTQSFGVTVAAAPVVAAISAQTIGIGKTDPIGIGLVSENFAASGETFTAVLTDSSGQLSATGATAGNGTNALTIANVSLNQLNADLATLTDKNGTAGPDNITMQVTDSFGNVSTQSFGVTVAAAPVIGSESAQTIGIGKTAAIGVGLVTEAFNASGSGETFTAVVTDSAGQLSATGATSGNGTNDLTIANVSLSQLNAELATLTDKNGTAGPDNITVQVTDSFGNIGTQTFGLTVAAAPVIGSVSAQTIGTNQTDPITVGTVAESFVASGETFTAVVTDSTGQLSATGATSGNGTNDLIIANVSLSQLNTDLATLTDKNATAGPDNITVQVTDSFGNIGTQTFGVTVNGAPVITGPGPQTIDVNKTAGISSVSMAESGNTVGETFTVTLTDSTGQLSANTSAPGGGGTISGSGTNDLVIQGTLSQVNADLTTLADRNSTAGADNITVHATDSFNNSATPQTIAVTVNTPDLPPVIDLADNENPNGSSNTVSYHFGTSSQILIAPNASIDDFGEASENSETMSITVTLTNPQDDSAGSGGANIKETLSLDSSAASIATTDGLTVTFGPVSTSVKNSPVTLSITGTASLADFEKILEGIQYADTKGGSQSSATRTLHVTVNDDGAVSAVQTVTINAAAPAGVAGAPINLALSNPPAANGQQVAVTVTGVPSDWQLNQGTNLGNGTWMVETDDLTALTVLTGAAYAGAMVLGVTETWTNADGTTGQSSFSDNVEAYAPGSPIFALPYDDTLTGAGGNDLFVFGQPIGNDVIHNFNAISDRIDLIGFDHVASFSDLQIADDSNGNAVVTAGSGETITLQGVDAASLTASNFQFDQTPTLDNSGTMVISDGAVLPLSGIVDNSGVIELNSTGDLTELVITGDGVTLEGGGQIVMSGSDNAIIGTSPNAILNNVDNTISGVGQIGTGDGNLTLVNGAAGTINADIAGGILTLDTGNTIVNYGLVEATNGGTLQVQDAVTGGTAVIAGGTIEFDAASSVAVTFDNGASGTTYGVLVLIDPSHFSGDISGFAGTAADLAHSDGIDVVGMNFNSGQFSDAYDSSTGVLSLSDGANTETLQFTGFKGDINNFHFAEDANGTGTLITDPPGLEKSANVSIASTDTTDSAATQSASLDVGQTTSVAIGGPGGDHFVFAPGIGAESVTNFNTQQDTIELDQFANAQTVQELQSLITPDAHGNAVIDFGHHDSVTLTGVTTPELQQAIQAGHVLLH